MNNNLIDLELIPPGIEVPVKITTDLYIRIQQCLLEGLPFKDLDHFRECLKSIQQNKTQSSPLAYHAHTLIHLLTLIEDSAKEQGLTQHKKFNPVDQTVSSS